jgi:hypothetical protein
VSRCVVQRRPGYDGLGINASRLTGPRSLHLPGSFSARRSSLRVCEVVPTLPVGWDYGAPSVEWSSRRGLTSVYTPMCYRGLPQRRSLGLWPRPITRLVGIPEASAVVVRLRPGFSI